MRAQVASGSCETITKPGPMGLRARPSRTGSVPRRAHSVRYTSARAGSAVAGGDGAPRRGPPPPPLVFAADGEVRTGRRPRPRGDRHGAAAPLERLARPRLPAHLEALLDE